MSREYPKNYSVSSFRAFKEFAEKQGFRVTTSDVEYQERGKYYIYAESKKFGRSLSITANKKYGANVATVEVGWSSAGTPRPSLADVEKFGTEVLKAAKVAKKLKAMKEVPLKSRK